MRNIGMEPVPSSTEAFDTYLKSETRKWGDVIRKANIKLQ
jgi:tripartite-type tricarboxylate transporter receptor subunit TctC